MNILPSLLSLVLIYTFPACYSSVPDSGTGELTAEMGIRVELLAYAAREREVE